MKTREFIEKLEELGCIAFFSGRDLLISMKCSDCIIAIVRADQMYACNTLLVNWASLMEFEKKQLFNLITEYAATPIEEREELKTYYFKHRWAKTKNGNWLYLALRKRPSISYLTLQGSSEDIFEYQVRFTREEIDEIKAKYNTDLSDFDEDEVEE